MKLTEAQNKQIAKWLDICNQSPFRCCECYRKGCSVSFDSRDGFWLIMDHGPKQGDKWDEWVSTTPKVFCQWYSPGERIRWAVKQSYIGEKLAVELIKFIEEATHETN